MSDRVFPASKQTPSNGTAAPPPPAKAHLLNPTARLPYRQPHNRHRPRPRRNYCCCLCFWTVLIIIILALVAAIAGAVFYMTYHPHRPAFTVSALRINRLKLTPAASSHSHLSTLFNLTLSSRNPNSRISFSYDPFAVSVVSAENGVVLGGGTLPAFLSVRKNESSFRGVAVSTTSDLDGESVKKLRSDLKVQNSGWIGLKIEMDTKVEVKIGKVKSKKVGMRVACDGIKGVVPKGKPPAAAADVSAAKCKVDLIRIKVWKWSF